jgi:hypothetical protein
LSLLIGITVYSKSLEEHLEAYKNIPKDSYSDRLQYVVNNQNDPELVKAFNDWLKSDVDDSNIELNSLMIKFIVIDNNTVKKLKPSEKHLITYYNLYNSYYPEKVDNVLKTGKLSDGTPVTQYKLIGLALLVNNESYLNTVKIDKVTIYIKTFIKYTLKNLILSKDYKKSYDQLIELDNLVSSLLIEKPDNDYLKNLLKEIQTTEDNVYIKLTRSNKL